MVAFRYPANPKEHFIVSYRFLRRDRHTRRRRIYQWKAPRGRVLIRENQGRHVANKGAPDSVVLGDNRNNSHDSRSQLVGCVPFRLVEGRAVWRYWPISSITVMEMPAAFAKFK